MNRIQLLSAAQTFDSPADKPEEKRPFSLVIIYDHESAATESHRIVEHLLSKWVPGLDIHCDSLSFSEIIHAELRTETIEIARDCDVLVLATSSRGAAVPAVAQWLDLWGVTRAPKETALVSLTSNSKGDSASDSLHDHLKQIAHSYGLTWFSSSLSCSGGTATGDLQDVCPQRPRRYQYLARPEGWGINE